MRGDRRGRLMMNQVKNPTVYPKKIAARKRGNSIDAYVKTRLKRKSALLSPIYKRYKSCIDPWINQVINRPAFAVCDQVVFNHEQGYAGTLDVVCDLPDWGMTVVNIKTCAFKIFPEAIESALLQTAAYRAAWNSCHCALRTNAIAAVFISPYGLTVEARIGNDVERYTQQFYQRCRQFAAAHNASSA
ncbi:MAG: hypothetical protein AAF921_03700 [Cyanobacteria bacterium P01_D01_bin.44]